MHAGTGEDDSSPTRFRLLAVPGTSPDRWLRVWRQRVPNVPLVLLPVPVAEQREMLLSGRADAGLVRLPLAADELSVIPLYTETSVVVLPRDHALADPEDLAGIVPLGLLNDEPLLVPDDDVLGLALLRRAGGGTPATTGAAVELVAAGAGVLVLPQSLARLHHRKDVTHRPVEGAPESAIALAWVADRTSDLVEELAGIVRGRTARSSRGGPGAADATTERAGGVTRAGSSGAARSSATGRGRARGGHAAGRRHGGRGRPGGSSRRSGR